jgi:hypothetical protein
LNHMLAFAVNTIHCRNHTDERHVVLPSIGLERKGEEERSRARYVQLPRFQASNEAGVVGPNVVGLRAKLHTLHPSTFTSCSTRLPHTPYQALSRPEKMAPSFPQFNPMRLRSYIFRLPLCTRVLAAVILGLWIATIPFPWLREFGRLEPAKMDFTQSTWI